MKMNGFMRLALVAILAISAGCSTAPVEEDTGATFSSEESAPTNEFAEFDSPAAADNSASPEANLESELAAASQPAESTPADSSLGGDEFAQFDQPPAEQTPALEEVAPVDTFAQEQVPPAIDPGQEEPPPPELTLDDAPVVAETPPAEAPAPEISDIEEAPVAAVDPSRLVNIVDLQYRANDNGGTIVVEADGPMQFNQRMNSDTNQFIVEIQNAKLPKKLKRPFNTRDFAGTIGAIDAYQGKNSSVARVVVQLRPGATEPVIQAEGKSLFVVAQPPGAADQADADGVLNSQENAVSSTPHPETMGSKLLTSDNIEEFLSSNQNFYGKRISIETIDDTEIRDILKLISEESNVNLVISDEVKGKVGLKLKNVPWDQALVMIMKTKKLGYSRVGNVIRIAPLADIRTEEEDAQKLATARKANAALKIKTVQLNYAKADDLEKQLKNILSNRGAVVGDPRTSSMIITDYEENVERAEKLIRSLDIPPQQVLIEGKIVEASDDFERSMGVNWGVTGRPTGIKGLRGVGGNVRSSTGFSVNPSVGDTSTFGMNFTLGTLDVLGDLNATLKLFERQDLVKVISSPRIVTLHNEPAEISQTTELPLITATLNANGSPTQQVNFKQVKLKLSVTPQITNDGAVIMGVDVGRDIAGASVDPATRAFPINSRAAKTKVIVKNNQTAVIGGIYQNDVTDGEQKVPLLGDVPLVGWLFKSKVSTKKRSELLVFLTPRLLGQLEGAPSSMSSGEGAEL